MTSLHTPEMEFRPYPTQNVELMVSAEAAIAAVPRSPELVEYDDWTQYPPLLDLVKLLGQDFNTLEGIAQSQVLPTDFVMYINPITAKKRTVSSHHLDGPPISIHQRLRYARSYTKYMSESLISRAHFVAAVTGVLLGFDGVSLDHQEKIGHDSEYADFSFEDMTDGNPNTSNDALLFKAILMPGYTATPSLVRLLAGEINDPEMSLITYSKLYQRGDPESFQMLVYWF